MISTQEAEPQVLRGPSRADQTFRPDAEPSEAEVIELAQRGDASAFERIYRRHSKRVFGLCLRMVSNIAAAEDLTQEVFLLVFRKIHSFRGDSAFSTWLHRIAVNTVLMRLRRAAPRESSLERGNGSDSDRGCPPENLSCADPQLVGSLDRVHLQRAIAQLRPSQQLVLDLHDIQGYKHSEIAAMLDWTIGNSKSHLHRARARLRQLLQCRIALHEISPSRAS